MIQADPQEHRDRRNSPRVTTTIPAIVDFVNSSTKRAERISASVTTLGAKGISFVTAAPLARGEYVDVYLEVAEFQIPLRLSGIIRWSIAGSDKRYFHGVRLDTIPPVSQSLYRSLLADQLLDQTNVTERRLSRELTTEVVQFSNRAGRKIVGLLDRSNAAKADVNGVVVIPPGYGEIKTDSLMLSYYLAKNGFIVLRYDATDHVGESDGEILNTRLSTMEVDVLSAVDFALSKFPQLSIGIVAASLSARVAVRAAANDVRIRFVVGIAGVVNLQATLLSVYKKDLIEGYREGEIRGTADILGFNVSDGFLEDAVRSDFHSLDGSCRDFDKLRIPTTFFVGAEDPWVNVDDVKAITKPRPDCVHQCVVVPGVFHNLYENPSAARSTLKEVVACAIRQLKGASSALGTILEPTLREVAIESRLERQRTRLLSHFDGVERVGFWEKYLTSFDLILKSADFNNLLQIITEKLGTLTGKRLLDVGCGNGNLGTWLMIPRDGHFEMANQSFIYVGIDYANAALLEAERRFQDVRKERTNSNVIVGRYVEWLLSVCDLNRPLPFLDSYFDKACSNLVLSYVDDPVWTLSEIRRVLAVGGTAVITSVKPHGNFSRVFNNFVGTSKNDGDLEEARLLLGNAGYIRHKEKEGHFRFFSGEELRHLMDQAGFVGLEICTAFEGDINIVTGVKV